MDRRQGHERLLQKIKFPKELWKAAQCGFFYFLKMKYTAARMQAMAAK